MKRVSEHALPPPSRRCAGRTRFRERQEVESEQRSLLRFLRARHSYVRVQQDGERGERANGHVRPIVGVVAITLSLALGFSCSVAHALKSDSSQPIKVRSQSVEANEKTGVSIYRGNVVITQGTLRLEADRVEITVRDGHAELVRAWGQPVHMRTRSDVGEELSAKAMRVEYHGQEQRIDLYGNVELKRDADIFTGAVVHYTLDEGTFVAEGDSNGQVSAVLQPAAPRAVQ